MADETNLSPSQKISSLNYKFDLGDFTVFDLHEDGENRVLLKKDGEPHSDQIWYTVDQNEVIQAVLPFDFLSIVLEDLSSLNNEILELKLEKTIWKYLPKDFHDVQTVVRAKMLQNSTNNTQEIDEIVQNIKKEYPNLFIDMDDILHH